MRSDHIIRQALHEVVESYATDVVPEGIGKAVRHAVYSDGHRIRPRVCLAVARACNNDHPDVALAAAVSIELLHCASLVHDDMPCFDNAATRRGRPSVHAAYGEQLALLCGDALIVMAFQHLSHAACVAPNRLATLIEVMGQCVGLPKGIVAGQAWECETEIDLKEYQKAKTGALFAASSMLGAAAAGRDHNEWITLGERLGQAYQVADDLLDQFGDPDVIGKPVGQDKALNRPNAVAELGLEASNRRLKRLIQEAVSSVPQCSGQAALRRLIERESRQFMEAALRSQAAA